MKTKFIQCKHLILALLLFCLLGCNPKQKVSEEPIRDAFAFPVKWHFSTDTIKVQFDIRHGNIIFPAILGGRNIDCMLDTGNGWALASDTALKTYKETPSTVSFTTIGPTSSPKYKLVTTALSIGSGKSTYEVSRLPVMIGKVRKDLNDRRDIKDAKGLLLQAPSIGNIAFSKTVLAIDYAQHTFEIHKQKPLSLVTSANCIIVPIHWHYSFSSMRYPVIGVKINGRMYNLLLDTGASVNFLELDDETAKLQFQGLRRNSILYTTPILTKHGFVYYDVSYKIGNRQLKTEVFVTRREKVPGRFYDGIIGNNLLQRFKVTIDYPNSTLYLQ